MFAKSKTKQKLSVLHWIFFALFPSKLEFFFIYEHIKTNSLEMRYSYETINESKIVLSLFYVFENLLLTQLQFWY